MGNRFGFVSFKGVRDVKDLEGSMKNIKMRNHKLVVNVARFTAENKEIQRQTGNLYSHPQGGNIGNGGRGNKCKHLSAGKYRDVLQGFSVGEGVADLKTLVKLDKLNKEANGPIIRLKYVGGLYMLLVFENKEELIKDYNLNFKVWFSWSEVWKGQSLSFERVAWLKITGVPLHLMDNEVFDLVGRLFGKVVHASALNFEDKDLAFDLIGVLVDDGNPIRDSVTLMWKEKKFKVWVVEELGDWVPDCISGIESCEDRSVSDSGTEDVESVNGSSSPDSDVRSSENRSLQKEVEKTGSQKDFNGGEEEEPVIKVTSKTPDVLIGQNIFENIEEGEIPPAFNMGRNSGGQGMKGSVFNRLGRPHMVFKEKKAQAHSYYQLVQGEPNSKKRRREVDGSRGGE
ncbi:hypothetical protein Hanom_Chr07g00648531 [Helianthus anomalus]